MTTVATAVPSNRPIALVAALLLAACPASQPRVRRSTSARRPIRPVRSRSRTSAGSVTVTGWDRNEVEITGELGDGTERLDFTKATRLTRIKVVLPERSYNVDDTDLIIKVPVGSVLSINTVSADVARPERAGHAAPADRERRRADPGERRGRRVPHRQWRRQHRRLGQEGRGVDHDREW